MTVEILRAGALTTVQDLGRAGHAHVGVPRSGAADLGAHRAANALVGNPAGAATLETTATGCTVRVRSATVVAVAGAACDVFVGGVRAPWGAPVRLGAGQALEVGEARRGLRSYLALRGGIAVPPVLGSRATDLLSGLGPAPLRDGDVLALGSSTAAPEALFGAARGESGSATPDGTIVLGLDLGPREDWCTPAALTLLAEAAWTASADSNRVGVRLSGPTLERAVAGELASEGMVRGAVQVPPSGHPVVFLADHPTTGGYPVVGVIDAASQARAAQIRPGDQVRFEVRPRPAR